MSSWAMNIDLPLEQVAALLNGMDGAVFTKTPDDLSLDFGERGGARAFDATPDTGTDILIGDETETLPWVIFDFLAERTSAVMWMVDDMSQVVFTRGTTAEALGLELATNREWARYEFYDDDGNWVVWRPPRDPRTGTES